MKRFVGKTRALFTGTTAYGKQVRTATAGVFTFGYGYQRKQNNRRVICHTLKVVLSAIGLKIDLNKYQKFLNIGDSYFEKDGFSSHRMRLIGV